MRGYLNCVSCCPGQWSTSVRVHRSALPGLRIPGCFGAGDRGGNRNCSRKVLHIWAHGYCKELPGCLPIRELEHKGRRTCNSEATFYFDVEHTYTFDSKKIRDKKIFKVLFSLFFQVIPVYEQGSQFQPSAIEMVDGQTSPPQLLTEADLISLMEKHGIGTVFNIKVKKCVVDIYNSPNIFLLPYQISKTS